VPARTQSFRFLATTVGFAVVLFIVIFWRLGSASFWDPDEAHYAEATREMLATGDWLAPYYNGQPFFDKPILFYWLQALPMSAGPASEAGARLAPAIAGVLLVAVTGWLGLELFGASVGLLAALMLATNAGVFALARYAILDLPFTLFLFGGLSAVAVGMRRDRRWLEYLGYMLAGLANATKGPVALILCGLAFCVAATVSAEARRRLLTLRWVQGGVIATLLGLPWPLYMLWRFGHQFVEGYILNENIRLFATPMYRGQPGWWFYVSIVVLGMLPWTGLLLVKAAAPFRRPGATTDADFAQVLLWSWVLAIVGFFSFSQFKLDHYVFPASPALCLLAACAWQEARDDMESRSARWGVRLVGPTLIVAGAVVAYVAYTRLDLGWSFQLVPGAVILAGLWSLQHGWSSRPLPPVPVAALAAMAIVYVGALGWVMPKLEEGKVVPDVARWVAAHATEADRVAAFRLNRWNTAYRFYVERPVSMVESDEEAREFFANPAPFYCLMTGTLYDALKAAGVPLRVAYEREGRWATSGRSLWRRAGETTRFVVAVRDPTAP